ncbi:MAG: hypothetical protein Q8Q09_10715 [Deltaproteobacteria bacterium]|nr:hypothetical protein [Deltaproteobacteria bacterium]
MSITRFAVVTVALSLALTACGGGTPASDVVAMDATSDTGMTMTMPEGGMMMVEAGATDGGASSGICGATTRACICACGMNAQCQTGCVNSNMDCGQCVARAQVNCCPAQAGAVASCAMAAQMESDAGPACTTQACIAQRCATELAAVQTCFNMQQSMGTCRMELEGCFGQYPLQCM